MDTRLELWLFFRKNLYNLGRYYSHITSEVIFIVFCW